MTYKQLDAYFWDAMGGPKIFIHLLWQRQARQALQAGATWFCLVRTHLHRTPQRCLEHGYYSGVVLSHKLTKKIEKVDFVAGSLHADLVVLEAGVCSRLPSNGVRFGCFGDQDHAGPQHGPFAAARGIL